MIEEGFEGIIRKVQEQHFVFLTAGFEFNEKINLNQRNYSGFCQPLQV
jgi:hypothetical protein